MDLTDYLQVLRRRWRSAAAALLLCLLATTVLTQALPRTYEATSQLFVSAALSDGSDPSGLYQGGQFAQARVKSYADIMTSPLVTRPVIARLGLDSTPAALAESIRATAPVDTVLINVTVSDRVPGRARLIADAVATEFISVVARIERPAGQVSTPLRVSLVRPAELPTNPASPKPLVNLVLGMLVGLVAAVSVAVIRERADTRVRSSGDLEELTGLPCLATIGYDRHARAEPIILGPHSRPQRAEAFRKLRTSLQFTSIDGRSRSLMVTSAVPAEGKSTTVANLAVALAQTGAKVLLVEADLRHPQLAGYLGLEGAVGLTDVLIGRVRVEDAVQPWHASGLVVLPAGSTPPNPSELLASQQMGALLRELERTYDLVLLDSPPVLAVTDAVVLASQTGATVLVVRSRSTRREQVTRALAALRQVGAPVRGTVLTMAKVFPQDDSRDYGQAYEPESMDVSGAGLLEESGLIEPEAAPAAPVPPVGASDPMLVSGPQSTDPAPR